MLTESVREHSQQHERRGDMLLLSCLRVVIVKSLLPVDGGEIRMFGWWWGLEWGMLWLLLLLVVVLMMMKDLGIHVWNL